MQEEPKRNALRKMICFQAECYLWITLNKFFEIKFNIHNIAYWFSVILRSFFEMTLNFHLEFARIKLFPSSAVFTTHTAKL